MAPLCLRPRAVRLGFQQALLPAAAGALRLDVLHSPSFIMPMIRGRVRHVLTIHDLTSFSLPEYHIPLRRSAWYRRAVLASIRRAHVVTTPSRFVRDAVLRTVPDVAPGVVRVVPWGIGEEFRPRVELGDPADAKPYLDMGVKDFCVGWDVVTLYEWFKNQGKAMRELLGVAIKEQPLGAAFRN